MQPTDDRALLRAFAENQSDEAFATLVARYVNLVYSVALRHLGNPHHAEEITQAVFIILAKKAAQLRHDRALAHWLFQTTRLTANNFVRSEARRHRREQEAYMQSTADESTPDVWPHIASLLDEVVASLREKERQAIVLRFYEGRNLREIGLALDLSEAAAEKRLSRALEKLRRSFARRGVTLSGGALAGAMALNSVQAAPAALGPAVTAVAVTKGATAGTSTLTLIKGALKMMLWTKAKTGIVLGIGGLLAAATTTAIIERNMSKTYEITNPTWADDPQYWSADPRVLGKNPKALILRPTRFPNADSIVLAWGPDENGPTRFMAKNVSLAKMLPLAYNTWASRTVLPSNISSERFDFMLTLANHSKQAREIYQKEIREKFGFTAHRETREVDALVLKAVHLPAAGMQTASGSKFSRIRSQYEIRMSHAHWSQLCMEIENQLGMPVVDNTDIGLAGRCYDFHLHWQPQPNESENNAFKRSLAEQLGLELAPGRASLNVLVVEQVK